MCPIPQRRRLSVNLRLAGSRFAPRGEDPGSNVAIISYDEKPGIQAIGNTVTDRPPRPDSHATFARDHEYKRHGTLNLVEGLFSKMARPMLRHIRVASKAELKTRILAHLEDLNRDPVVHAWTYKIGEAA
jgi:hypothetical protein